MKRLARCAGILAAVTLVLVAVLFIAAWHYMERPQTIENIRAALADGLGGDVRFADLDVMPLRGASLERIRIYAEPEERPGEEFLSIGQLRLDYRPWRLLMRTLDFRSIRVDAPRLVLRQRPDGTWRHPRLNLGSISEKLTFRTGLLRFSILLDNFALANGSIQMLDDQGANLYEARGIRLDGELTLGPGSGRASGRLAIEEMNWGGLLSASGMSSPLQFQDGILLLPGISASMHGGQVRGEARVDLATATTEFSSKLRLEGLRIDQLLDEFRARSGLVTGLLKATAQFQGSMASPSLLRGGGEFEIQGARVFLLSGISPLDRLLDIPELRSHAFPSLHGVFKVAEETLTFYNLEAASDSIQITASGTAHFDRRIDFDILIALSPHLAGQIPEKNRARLNRRNDGFFTTTFKITGTLDQPRSNLAEKLGFSAPRLP